MNQAILQEMDHLFNKKRKYSSGLNIRVNFDLLSLK